MRDHHHHVVIVGGGFSGVALAAHLARGGDERLQVTLLEAGERLGRGSAYDTSIDAHLLNTRAEQMSLFTDDPEHFLRFLRWCEHSRRPVDRLAFFPRQAYGDYLEDALIETLMLRPPDRCPRFTAQMRARVENVTRHSGGFQVAIEDGQAVACDTVVLTTGQAPPADPLAAWLGEDARRYLRNPWQQAGIEAIASEERVLLLGTGLTMVDVVLTLQCHGHRGEIHAVSRRGLLPKAHAEVPQSLPIDLRNKLYAALAHGSLGDMLRAVRGIARAAELRGLGWHPVIDALRPVMPTLWATLDATERRRFVRCLRPYWDVHRHRVAPQPAATIAAMLEAGQLEVCAGRIRHAVGLGDTIVVERTNRGDSRVRRDSYDRVVNCTGPGSTSSPARALERQLVEQGLLTPDPLGLGYETGPNGAAVGARGLVAGLYVLGPACRSRYWECTAVPELRRRAEKLSAELLKPRNGLRRFAPVRVLPAIRPTADVAAFGAS